MKAGSLFAGIGGFDLGFQWAGIETAWQVEKDPFCQKVLAKHWPDVKRYGDIYDFIEEIKSSQVEPVDIIAGGFPCQPFSQAGKRKGQEDDRYLWPAMVEVISLLRPAWVVGENVAGILNMGFEDMLLELEGQGYRTETLIIPACAVNAPHRRDRVWIIANSIEPRTKGKNREASDQRRETCTAGTEGIRQGNGQACTGGFDSADCHAPNTEKPERQQSRYPRSGGDGPANKNFHAPNTEGLRRGGQTQPEVGGKEVEREQGCGFDDCLEDALNTSNQGLQGGERTGTHDKGQAAHGPVAQRNSAWDEPWIEAATRTCARSLDDGLSGGLVRPRGWRVNALKAAGNAVVPHIPYVIGKAIKEMMGG